MWNSGGWTYSDTGTAMSDIFHNWKDGKSPDGSSKSCVKREKKDGSWKEDDCTHEHNFFCEYEGLDCRKC